MRLNWLAALLVAAFACPWVIPAGPASAQALSVSDAASANQSALDAINDIFIGKNTRGPYVLSWNNVDPDSELIVVAGRKMSRGNDYTIDYPSGSIAFSESLPQGAVARATYRRIPGKSAANAGGISLPLSMRLLNSDRGNLDVMGFYRNSGNNSADQGIGAVGFGGGLKFGAGSEVTSTFLVSQGDDAKTGQKSSFADRSAIKLGTTTSIGGLAFKASFARAGEQFSGSKEYGLQQAKQFLDLAGTWGKTSDVVYASFSYKQQDNLAGAQKGLAQTSTDDKIALNLPTGSKLSVTHSASDNGLSGAAAKTSSNDSLQLDQAIGSKTTATALVQRSQVNTGKSLDETGMTRFGIQSTALSGASFHGNWQQKSSLKSGDETTVDVGVNAKSGRNTTIDASYLSSETDRAGQQATTALRMATSPLDFMQLTGGLSWKNSDRAGAETGFDVGMNVTPDKRINISANHSEVSSDKNGQQTSTDVRMAASPLNMIQLNTSFVHKVSDRTGEETGMDASVKLRPIKQIGFDASLSNTDSDRSGQTTRTAFKFAAQPLSMLDIAGDYSRLDALVGGQVYTGIRVAARPMAGIKFEVSQSGKQPYQGAAEQQRGMSIEAQPANYVKLAASLNQQAVGAQEKMNTSARVELAPGKNVRVAHSYTQANDGYAVSTVKDYSGAVKPAGFVEVSGGFKSRQKTGVADLNSESVKVALDPTKSVRLTGQYALNPEDGKGIVQRQGTRSFGVAMKVGVMGLTGGYTQKNDLVVGNSSLETEVGMSFRVFGNGNLSTGYKLASASGAAQRDAQTYSVGYTHIIGSSFNLALSGEMTRRAMESLAAQDEYKATAKLGLSF